MEALLSTPDKQTNQGKRDYTLLLFLYNTGEAAQLTIADLTIAPVKQDISTVLIRGKGKN